jgi:hypothetical protein
MELALLRGRGAGLVPQLPLLHELREVAFFRGTALVPLPPGVSKHKEVRYFDIGKEADCDEPQLANWIRQAAVLPGWVP